MPSRILTHSHQHQKEGLHSLEVHKPLRVTVQQRNKEAEKQGVKKTETQRSKKQKREAKKQTSKEAETQISKGAWKSRNAEKQGNPKRTNSKH